MKLLANSLMQPGVIPDIARALSSSIRCCCSCKPEFTFESGTDLLVNMVEEAGPAAGLYGAKVSTHAICRCV